MSKNLFRDTIKKVLLIIAIIVGSIWAGYINRFNDVSKNLKENEDKSPKLISLISSSSKESELYKTDLIIKNDGNGSATSIQLKIESDTKIEKVKHLLCKTGLDIFHEDYSNANKIYFLEFDRLLPQQKLTIIFYTKEKPYIKLKNIIYTERSNKMR